MSYIWKSPLTSKDISEKLIFQLGLLHVNWLHNTLKVKLLQNFALRLKLKMLLRKTQPFLIKNADLNLNIWQP